MGRMMMVLWMPPRRSPGSESMPMRSAIFWVLPILKVMPEPATV